MQTYVLLAVLFLKVDKRGGAYWNLRLQQDGKRRDIGVGSAKLVTLAEARAKAADLRKAVKVEKRDVLTERKDEEAAKVLNFCQIQLALIAERELNLHKEILDCKIQQEFLTTTIAELSKLLTPNGRTENET